MGKHGEGNATRSIGGREIRTAPKIRRAVLLPARDSVGIGDAMKAMSALPR